MTSDRSRLEGGTISSPTGPDAGTSFQASPLQASETGGSACRCDDDVTVGVLALRSGHHAFDLVDGVVHRLPVSGAHGLERPLLTRLHNLFGDLGTEASESRRTLLSIAGDVDQDPIRPRRT